MGSDLTPEEMDEMIKTDPIKALDTLLAETGFVVRFGLSAAQMRDIAARVVAREDWPKIGKAIGWDPATLRDWWEREAARIILEREP